MQINKIKIEIDSSSNIFILFSTVKYKNTKIVKLRYKAFFQVTDDASSIDKMSISFSMRIQLLYNKK